MYALYPTRATEKKNHEYQSHWKINDKNILVEARIRNTNIKFFFRSFVRI